jgi:hypothetical protein
MRRYIVLAVAAGLALAPALHAQGGSAQGLGSPAPASPPPGPALPSVPAYLPDDPASYLGLGLAEAWTRFGPPEKVEVVRGEAGWQDDVVFAYGGGYALYWSVDRLWQIRFGQGYAGSVHGIFLGDASDKVISTLGTPYFRNDGNLVFRLAWRGYPVRLRAVLLAGKVAELYVYRADF